MLGFFDKYPYTDFHELNLDWLLKAVRDLAKEMHDWEIVNQISYQGIWDITKNYPKSSVVTDNNDGYISIQPVPVGINISNSDYWIKIANFSQELADLGNRVIALEAEDININNKISTVNKNKEERKFTGKRIICVSDSYGNYPAANQSWIKYLQDITGLTSSDFFKVAQNGSGFVGNPGIDTFLTILTNAASSISNHDTITDIVVSGGYNDANHLAGGGTTTDIITAVQAFSLYCKTTYPNAKVHLIPSCWTNEHNNVHKPIRNYVSCCLQAIGSLNNTVFSDCALYALHDTICIGPGVDIHPTDYGSQFIADSIASYLLGGSGYNYGSLGAITPTFTVASGVSNLQFLDGSMCADKSTVHFGFGFAQIDFAASTNLTFNTPIKICDFIRTLMVGGNTDEESYIATTCMRAGSDDFTGQVIIKDNALYINPNKDVTGITRVYITPTQLTGPAML